MRNEGKLVAWFLDLYQSRTPAKCVLDVSPGYRVIWTEVRTKMKEMGWNENAVDLREIWDQIFQRHDLKRRINKMRDLAGEKPE